MGSGDQKNGREDEKENGINKLFLFFFCLMANFSEAHYVTRRRARVSRLQSQDSAALPSRQRRLRKQMPEERDPHSDLDLDPDCWNSHRPRRSEPAEATEL